MKAVLTFLRRVASSRVGKFLVISHLIFIVYEFAQKPAATYAETPCVVEPGSASFIAGRDYHWHYESTSLKIVHVLDLPALVVGGLALELLSPVKFCAFTASWVYAIFFLTFTSIQWLIVGFIVQSIFRWLKKWREPGLINRPDNKACS